MSDPAPEPSRRVTTEIERKYAVTSEAVLPDLTEADGVASVEEPQETALDATYFDTADLGLLRRKVTLRRRAGGHDEGWHLKLPDLGSGRREVQVPLDAGEPDVVPVELARLVVALTDERPLLPVARVRNDRRTTLLLDADGDVLAEVCEDRVAAESLLVSGDDRAPLRGERWTEWEVELVEGDEAVLDAVEPLLLSAGAEPGAAPSKLGRALGHHLDDLGDHGATTPPGDDVARRIRAYLAAQDDRLRQHDLRLRVGEDDAVHQLRVAARRLRSVLTCLARGERASVARTIEGLRRLGRALGDTRDAGLVRDRVAAAAAARGEERSQALAELLAALEPGEPSAAPVDSLHHQVLLRSLSTALGKRRLLRDDVDPARSVEHERRRVGRRVARWEERRDIADTEAHERLHEARKAVKRLRYVAEALGDDHAARAAKAAQSAIGDHLDALLCLHVLDALGEPDDADRLSPAARALREDLRSDLAAEAADLARVRDALEALGADPPAGQ